MAAWGFGTRRGIGRIVLGERTSCCSAPIPDPVAENVEVLIEIIQTSNASAFERASNAPDPECPYSQETCKSRPAALRRKARRQPRTKSSGILRWMSRKRFILWDHDGVLVETEPWYFEATREAIAPLGVELELPDYLRDMADGRTAWERARALGVEEAAIEAHRDHRNILYQRYLQTEDIGIPGVEDALRQLAPRYRMAIVTTSRKPDFELIHRERNIVAHMDFVLANGDYARSKPAPDPYLAALARFEAEREEAVVVEDSERGLRAAVAAGIECIVVANEFVRGQDLSAATWQVESLAEIGPLLARV